MIEGNPSPGGNQEREPDTNAEVIGEFALLREELFDEIHEGTETGRQLKIIMDAEDMSLSELMHEAIFGDLSDPDGENTLHNS